MGNPGCSATVTGDVVFVKLSSVARLQGISRSPTVANGRRRLHSKVIVVAGVSTTGGGRRLHDRNEVVFPPVDNSGVELGVRWQSRGCTADRDCRVGRIASGRESPARGAGERRATTGG
ncbi:hypothetical protein L2E82_25222 [Cichorium intybus]|uniref:Uncharacterized protein n=1 Tax=Cichorium intybus TaxID=13427 RepID=A0ACB9E405_CICIN|nr:hypothetical protein L2E82_25222 [Cichorium intybus]